MKKSKSPSYLIISGTHGNETNAVQDVFDLKLRFDEKIDTRLLDKNIDFYQGWNKTALEFCTREFQKAEDEIPSDLNRAFTDKIPEDKECIVEELKSKIKVNDVIIDVHNSPLLRNCVVINNGPYARNYVHFCKDKGLDFLLIESTTDTIKKYATDNNKVGFTVEIGDMGFTDSKDGVDFLIKLIAGIANKLAEDGDTFSRDIPQLGPFAYTEVSQEVYVHSKGLLRVIGDNGLTGIERAGVKPRRSEVLRHYSKGEIMFVVADPETNEIKELIKAPCEGTLMDLLEGYWVVEGLSIGTFQPDISYDTILNG